MKTYKILKTDDVFLNGKTVGDTVTANIGDTLEKTLISEGYIEEVKEKRVLGMPALERVKEGGTYFCLDIFGGGEVIVKCSDDRHCLDDSRFDIGNYFLTREDAEHALAIRKAEAELMRASMKVSGGKYADDDVFDHIAFDLRSNKFVVVHGFSGVSTPIWLRFIFDTDCSQAFLTTEGVQEALKVYWGIK